MKVLLLNGSPRERGCTHTALCEAERAFSALGVQTEIFWVGKQVTGCMACGACKKLGKCVLSDRVNELSARLSEFDGIIVGSPVYYASPSGQIVSFLDRLFYSAGKKLAGKPGACVVSCRRGGASASFDALNKYFSINNMPIVTSQYWNQVHGNTPEEVRKDEEGMQTVRTLAKNMTYLLSCIEAGKRAGILPPVYEEKIATNFIR
ncbi:MAG: flavodoxin family protein [Clostridia bacterium]|nr:flavodoxin family protein [Clostridia bacterium]